MKKVSNFVNMLRIRLRREQIYTRSEYWDQKAVEYTDKSISLWPNPSLNELYHKEQIALIDNLTGNIAESCLLDVGCGMGRMSRHFAQRGASVLGLDFSARTIDLAIRFSSAPNPSFEVKSFFDLEKESEYDFLFISAALTVACKESSDVYNILQRFRKALKQDGRLIVVEPLHRGFLHRVLNMNASEFSKIVEDAGFRIEETHQLHFWPMRLALAYIPWPSWITAPCYHFGQILMSLPGFQGMGDYKAIKAVAV
jgi:2-polyprenyl-3-methyl-5-hydroxy-6-metoxy-1,4-benzoquinol methylase